MIGVVPSGCVDAGRGGGGIAAAGTAGAGGGSHDSY